MVVSVKNVWRYWMKIEYKVLDHSWPLNEEKLNILGKDGWVLIIVIKCNDYYQHYFKRVEGIKDVTDAGCEVCRGGLRDED
jgi:hypothetical protein